MNADHEIWITATEQRKEKRIWIDSPQYKQINGSQQLSLDFIIPLRRLTRMRIEHVKTEKIGFKR